MERHKKAFAKLKRLQSLSLQEKIKESIDRIKEWYEAWDGMVYGAFSGGKDSTVMMDIIWKIYSNVPAIFGNTGLEYPEIVSFVKEIAAEHPVEIVRPDMPFHKVIQKYGYPVLGKQQARYISEVQRAKTQDTPTVKLRLKGIKTSGKYGSGVSPRSKISKKWQYLCYSGVPISDKCCLIIKKRPLQNYANKTNRKPFIGIMATEGGRRKLTYLEYGCNAFDLAKSPHSWPLSFWTEKDVWEYIIKYNVRYSKIYDMGYPRTGCMFCMFGVHLEQKALGTNRFLLMKKTHPKQYDYCINKLGIGKVLDLIKVPYGNPFKFGY